VPQIIPYLSELSLADMIKLPIIGRVTSDRWLERHHRSST